MANGNGVTDSTEGVLGLARETIDALGQLTMQHVRLARLELKADLHSLVGPATVLAVLALAGTVGYGLAVAGLAFLAGGGTTAGLPFLLIGLAHVIVSVVGIAVTVRRLRRIRPMSTTAGEVNRSVRPLVVAATTGQAMKLEAGRDGSS